MHKKNSGRSFVQSLALGLVVAAAAMLSGCATSYVDTATKEVPVASMKRPEQPKPVQLVFEFQSKGAPNARATEFLKDDVLKQVSESGLFTNVTTTPTPNAALLNVTLNNVPVTDNAYGKGFVTGLTFGIAGNVVTDGYICELSYLPAGQTQPIVKRERHAIHTAIGNASPPAGAEKSPDVRTAVRKMTRDIVSNALKDLADDASFQ